MRPRSSRYRRQSLPASLRSPRERREYFIAYGIVAALQMGIAASLVVSAVQTYRMSRQHLAYVPAEIGRVVPAFLILGAAIAIAAGLKTLARIRAVRAIPVETDPGE